MENYFGAVDEIDSAIWHNPAIIVIKMNALTYGLTYEKFLGTQSKRTDSNWSIYRGP